MKVYNGVLCCVTLCALAAFNAVHAHYPHDVFEFVTLSPNFSEDSTVFVSQKQGSSTRSEVVLVSRDKGMSWEYNPVGMDNTSQFTSVTVSPLYATDNTVYMTTENGAVYRSGDGGRTLVKLNQQNPTVKLSNSAAGLDSSGAVVLFVSGEEGGLYCSVDSGLSWEVVLAQNVAVEEFALSPNFDVDGTVLAGGPSGALFISVDGGITFNSLDSLGGVGTTTRIVLAPNYATSGEIYVGTTAGLYHSNDAGNSFVKIENLASAWVSALALSPDYGTDSTVFAATPTHGVFKSTDAGLSWVWHETGVPLSDQSNIHFFDIKLSEDYANDGVVFLATFEGLLRSDDRGQSWTELETRPPTLIMGVALSPDFAQDGLILVSTYGGGLYVSQDAGANWNVANNGLIFTYTYQVAATRGSGVDPILMSSQANYALVSFDKGASWTRKLFNGVNQCIPSALGVSPAFVSDQTMLLACRKDGFKITHDGGDTWQTLISAAQLQTGLITSVEMSPDYAADSTAFFANWNGYFARSRDGGNSWQLIRNGLPGPWNHFGGTSIAVSPDFANDNYLAAATPKGFYKSLNSGDNWWPTQDTSSPVASGVIEYVGISPDFKQDGTLLASVRGKGLFRSSDAGANWQRVGAGLHESGYDVKGIAFSPDFARDGVVIGYGHDHLLRSTDRGDTFELFDIPFIRHEDGREQSVYYQGAWIKVINESASATSFRASATAGEEVSLSFRGTGVSWIGAQAEILGIAGVYVDGNLVAVVDQYNPTALWRQKLYSISGLPLGLHQIRVVATNSRNPDATGNWTTVDAFDVIR